MPNTTQASSLFAVQDEMLSLLQGETEHIRDYVHCVEKLSRKIPKDMDSLFAIAFVKGMRDQDRKQRVTFDLKDSPNFSFVKALTVVKFSFQEIGEPDPFRPAQPACEMPTSQVPLYTNPVLSSVNTVNKADISTPLTGNISLTLTATLILTQEQFNTFMSSYEATMGRVPRFPSSLQGNPATNRRVNSCVTCFNCGNRGYYADACVNQPLSTYEQQEVRDRIRKERELTTQDYRRPEPLPLPPLTGSNLVDVTPRAILPRQGNEQPKVGTTAPVSCLRFCSVSRKDLGIACVVAARIPAVHTIFENPLVEKRARVDDSESDSINIQRAPKFTRRSGELGENSHLRHTLRPTNNPLANRKGPKLPAVENEDEDNAEEEEQVMGKVIRLADGFEKIGRPAIERIQEVSNLKLPKTEKEKAEIHQ